MTSGVRHICGLRELVAQHLGLDFPPERAADLWRGLAAAAAEAGFEHAEGLAEQLIAAPWSAAQLRLLASHLTVGETYFFRDTRAFAALEEKVLPGLIAAARERGRRRLRLWSTACCTGEEAYSLAIAVRRALPDAAEWDLEIFASDISPRFLEKAARGVFGEWSFRDTAPGFRERYFTRVGERRWEIAPAIRGMVRCFAHNLADDAPPVALRDAPSFDLILCRNVLIYFKAEEAAKVANRLAGWLNDRGWLVLGPNELSYGAIPGLSAVRFPGAIFHRKGQDRAEASSRPEILLRTEESPVMSQPERIVPVRRVESAPIPAGPPIAPRPVAPEPAPSAPVQLLAAARALANQGKLGEATAACDQLLALHKLEPAAHYLRAVIFEENGEPENAVAALRNALYLEPEFVVAHWQLGNSMRAQERWTEADRHFENALALLRRRPADEMIPETEGLTAGAMIEMIISVQAAGSALRTK